MSPFPQAWRRLQTSLRIPRQILSHRSKALPFTRLPESSLAPLPTLFLSKKKGGTLSACTSFPFVYQSYDLTSANFSVSTQQFILLSNFQATNSSVAEFKEYSMNINTDTLILTFTPMGKSLLAFINAIEVVSVPDDLISDSAQSLNPIGTYNGLKEQVIETIHRINMGGLPVLSAQDTLWRSWQSDQNFLINKNAAKFYSFTGTINYVQGGATKDTAPELVYSTATELIASNTSLSLYNVTWEFDVDTSFPLMIRLHFCDIVSKVLNQLYFNLYINGLIGIEDLDLSALTTNTLAAAYYVDFFLRPSNGSVKVHVSIGPSTLANVQPDGILNGLEMLKMNTSMSSFDGQVSIVSKNESKRKLALLLGSLLGAFFVVVIAVFLFWVLSKRRKLLRNYQSKTWLHLSNFKDGIHSPVSKCSNGTTHQNAFRTSVPFAVLQEATNNFDEDWVIGVGGFGNVYKGELKDKTKVAVKRGNSKSHQGITEFRTEIEFLSQLRHRHLVSLIGYCNENNEMILVYEFMKNGTLKSHLYGLGLPPLSWKQRLEICIGSAKGVHYLHTGSAKSIIHRDIKSANILLDENLMAKVADFGLSKAGPDLDETHVTTAVKGVLGTSIQNIFECNG
ncbi:hypothetical protein HPP92_015564 [Vanilla planifolia]|uniref:Protein kinase domain-containing protein n=1 Tax=Vanilla planifolia TaxID=51239 RepID=A0A835UTT2_VANPL|nr:hypothetical protein HPP92_015564 [Vanilla planifolia]